MISADSALHLRNLLAREKAIIAPGVFDGLSAHLVRRAGFEAAYASGGAISRSFGFPDIGLLSLTEMAGQLARIVEAAGVPVIADADTGFGGPTNVWRTVREYSRAGVAGLHIEDQATPKRCGHLDGKALIAVSEMCEKIRAAKDAAAGGIVVIARTDAIAVEGFSRAMKRAEAYAEAGADVLFVEAPENVDQIRQIGMQFKAPKLINMFVGGKTPLVPVRELEQLGYKLIIIPSDLQRAVIHAMQSVLSAIKQDGDSSRVQGLLAAFPLRDVVVDADAFADREDRFRGHQTTLAADCAGRHPASHTGSPS